MARRQTPEALIEYARWHDIDTHDVREAAHEISHVVDARMSPSVPWRRGDVADALRRACTDRHGRLDRRMYFRCEIRARAVEYIVCRELGEPYDLMAWAKICYFDLAKGSMLDLLPHRTVNCVAREVFSEAGRPKTVLSARAISRLRVQHDSDDAAPASPNKNWRPFVARVATDGTRT